MVKLGWKSLTEQGPDRSGRTRIVSDPIRHQGVRSALRTVFDERDTLPAEWRALLAKLD